jgi:hypothetical protein
MNGNRIVTDTWSNPESRRLYEERWPNDAVLDVANRDGSQCGGCAFFAPFNDDWGLCANQRSGHYLETVFEHFACTVHVDEGWGPHSFSADPEFQCRCKGEGSEYWDHIAEILASK